MNAIMEALGCEGENGLYEHEDLSVSFDLTATADDKILLAIRNKMAELGYDYDACKNEFKSWLG